MANSSTRTSLPVAARAVPSPRVDDASMHHIAPIHRAAWRDDHRHTTGQRTLGAARRAGVRWPGAHSVARSWTTRCSAARVLADLYAGRTTTMDVCDAQSVPLQAARYHGDPTDDACPVCRKERLINVHYVYGDRARAACPARPSRSPSCTDGRRAGEFTVLRGGGLPVLRLEPPGTSYVLGADDASGGGRRGVGRPARRPGGRNRGWVRCRPAVPGRRQVTDDRRTDRRPGSASAAPPRQGTPTRPSRNRPRRGAPCPPGERNGQAPARPERPTSPARRDPAQRAPGQRCPQATGPGAAGPGRPRPAGPARERPGPNGAAPERSGRERPPAPAAGPSAPAPARSPRPGVRAQPRPAHPSGGRLEHRRPRAPPATHESARPLATAAYDATAAAGPPAAAGRVDARPGTAPTVATESCRAPPLPAGPAAPDDPPRRSRPVAAAAGRRAAERAPGQARGHDPAPAALAARQADRLRRARRRCPGPGPRLRDRLDRLPHPLGRRRDEQPDRDDLLRRRHDRWRASRQAQNRINVPLAQVPVCVQHAVPRAENRSFYTDPGFSPTGIARAAFNNAQGGTGGGSTITQQYVKNVLVNDEHSFSRKFKEVVIAAKIKQEDSKDQILENYLNTIYFGRGAYGIQAAAQAYFGRDGAADPGRGRRARRPDPVAVASTTPPRPDAAQAAVELRPRRHGRPEVAHAEPTARPRCSRREPHLKQPRPARPGSRTTTAATSSRRSRTSSPSYGFTEQQVNQEGLQGRDDRRPSSSSRPPTPRSKTLDGQPDEPADGAGLGGPADGRRARLLRRHQRLGLRLRAGRAPARFVVQAVRAARRPRAQPAHRTRHDLRRLHARRRSRARRSRTPTARAARTATSRRR